jgi:hypothetical protein
MMEVVRLVVTVSLSRQEVGPVRAWHGKSARLLPGGRSYLLFDDMPRRKLEVTQFTPALPLPGIQDRRDSTTLCGRGW